MLKQPSALTNPDTQLGCKFSKAGTLGLGATSISFIKSATHSFKPKFNEALRDNILIRPLLVKCSLLAILLTISLYKI
jgi:hypothetical protein